MASSNWWLTQIQNTENEIADLRTLKLTGVKIVENGNDKLELDKRMRELREHLKWLNDEYNKALVLEGKVDGSDYCFIPSRRYGV